MEPVMNDAKFIYEIYIASDPQSVWKSLIDPEITSKYWQHTNDSTWEKGAKWVHKNIKNNAADLTGKVIEFTPGKRLALSWAFPDDELDMKKHSEVSLELEWFHETTRLTVIHELLEEGSDMHEGIMKGWPKVLSSLKTLLETGKPLPVLW